MGIAVLLALQLLGGHADPFAFFDPPITLNAEERRGLDTGKPIVRVLPGRGHEVAVFAAITAAIDGDRLIAWTRDIAALKRGPYVLAIGRFSPAPAASDLDALVLDDDELAELRECRVNACDINLSAGEIRRMQASIGNGRDWKAAARRTLAEILAARAAGYVDAADDGERETFLYWSKERLGRQPVISVTHVAITRDGAPGRPDVVIISTNVFATRYIDTSVSVTVLTAGGDGARRYLAYVNRTDVDAVGGLFGGLVRWIVERRLKSDAEQMLPQLRKRLERGDPDEEGSESR